MAIPVPRRIAVIENTCRGLGSTGSMSASDRAEGTERGWITRNLSAYFEVSCNSMQWMRGQSCHSVTPSPKCFSEGGVSTTFDEREAMHSTGGGGSGRQLPPQTNCWPEAPWGGEGQLEGGFREGQMGGRSRRGWGGGPPGRSGGGGGPGGAIWGVGGGGGHRLLLPLITKRSLPNSTAALLQPAVGQGIVLSHSQPLVQAVPPW